MSKHFRNLLVFACVVVIHVGLLMTFKNERSVLHLSEREEYSELVILDTHPNKKPTVVRKLQTHPTLQRRSPVPENPAVSSLLILQPMTTPPVEWDKEAAKAADSALRRQTDEEAHRFFTPERKHLLGLSTAGISPGDKAVESKHQKGDSKRYDDGEVVTWINDNCYITNQTLPGPRLDENRANIVCTHGKPLIDIESMSELKPQYLRQPLKPKEGAAHEPH